MAVFRIEKTQNYTVMSNHHLRNPAISLKAKGLLSQILSLPENWDYTLSGLSRINRESVDAIRTAVQELERAGYVTRSRERKENGQLGGAEYIIHELPQEPENFTPDNTPTLPQSKSLALDKGTTPPTSKPTISNPPTQDKPIWENPTQANSALENPTQLNKDKAITEKSINDLSNTESNPIPPQTPSQHTPAQPRNKNMDRKGREAAQSESVFNSQSMSAFDIYREIIQDNIEYDHLQDNYKYDRDRIDEIVDLMLETVCTSRQTIRIASDDYPAELVKAKFLKLDHMHIEYVLECLKKNTTDIRNIKKYMLAVLFNAPSTMDSYYTSLVAHDMASGKFYKGNVT